MSGLKRYILCAVVLLMILINNSTCRSLNSFRGLKDFAGSRPLHTFHGSCEGKCNGDYDICSGITYKMNEQMLCLKLRMICMLDCTNKNKKTSTIKHKKISKHSIFSMKNKDAVNIT